MRFGLLGQVVAAAGMVSLSEAFRYGFELLIFFLGVYLAFLLTGYQEEKNELEIQAKYYDSLIHEFEMLVRHLDDEATKLKNHLAVLDEIKEGNRPLIPTSDLYFLHRGLVVNSAFDGLNFESLDFKIIANIVRGVPALELLDGRIAMFNQLSAGLPAMQVQGDSCCYNEDGALLPHMAWYPRLIDEIYEINRQFRAIVADAAIPDIRKGKERLLGID